MRYLFLILLTFAAQENLTAKDHDSLQKYYANKYAAEMAIVDSDYVKAVLLYDSAFYYKRPHEKDLYNAFILACLLKNNLLAQKYFDQLVFLGMTEDGFIYDLKQAKVDTTILSQINSNYQQVHQRSLRTPLRGNAKVMDSLYDRDQGIRTYAMNMYGHIEGPKRFNDSFVVVDSINIHYMLDFIRVKGFPDIYKTGFYAKSYIHISSYPMISLLLKHTWGIPSSRTDKAVLLWQVKKAVMEGEYDPRDYAFFYDAGDGNNLYGSILQTGDRKIGDAQLTREKIERINIIREQIYLEPLDDYIRKVNFMKTSNRFYFFNFFLIMHNQAFYVPSTIKPK